MSHTNQPTITPQIPRRLPLVFLFLATLGALTSLSGLGMLVLLSPWAESSLTDAPASDCMGGDLVGLMVLAFGGFLTVAGAGAGLLGAVLYWGMKRRVDAVED